jgi:acylphosphatase
MKRLIAHISGKVQGVGYRSMVVMMARTLDIKGYIQNLPDGMVFIIAEGAGEDLARFIKSIRIDNSRIVVDDIFIDCKEAKGEFNNFYKMDSKQVSSVQTVTASQSQKGQRSNARGRYLPATSGLEKIGFETERVNHKPEKVAKDREGLVEEMESSSDLLLNGRSETRE